MYVSSIWRWLLLRYTLSLWLSPYTWIAASRLSYHRRISPLYGLLSFGMNWNTSCSLSPASRIPSVLLAMNLSGTVICHFVVFSQIFLIIAGFSATCLTGTSPKSRVSGKSSIDRCPTALIGTMNFSRSVTTIKS